MFWIQLVRYQNMPHMPSQQNKENTTCLTRLHDAPRKDIVNIARIPPLSLVAGSGFAIFVPLKHHKKVNYHHLNSFQWLCITTPQKGRYSKTPKNGSKICQTGGWRPSLPRLRAPVSSKSWCLGGWSKWHLPTCCPKNPDPSKMTILRTQNPAIQVHSPFHWRVQEFLGLMYKHLVNSELNKLPSLTGLRIHEASTAQ